MQEQYGGFIFMIPADVTHISVPVTCLRTSNQRIPYVSSSMPSKVQTTLLKNELQEAQVSCNKLSTHKNYLIFSTIGLRCFATLAPPCTNDMSSPDACQHLGQVTANTM